MLREVEFKGKVSEEMLRKLYSQAEFIVSASRFEGFGISIVEGMASRCIPVVNSIEAFKLLVKHGKTGFLIDFDNKDEAASRILHINQMWRQEKEMYADAAKEASQDFLWERRIGKLEGIYRENLKN